MSSGIKTVTFTHQDGSTKVFRLEQNMKGVNVRGNRPIKAAFNFSKDDEKLRSKSELENIHCGVIPSLHPMLGVIAYEGDFNVYAK